MSFSKSIREFAKKSVANAAIVHKKVSIDLFSAIILSTPAKTGRLRGNWQTETRVYATGEIERLDPNGVLAMEEMAGVIDKAAPHVAFTLTNNLPYARRIEYDNWSKQAPAGMVRINVARFNEFLREAVEDVAK